MITLELSPRAVRFLIDALEAQIAAFEASSRKAGISEDEVADLGNDIRYLQGVRDSLKHSLKST